MLKDNYINTDSYWTSPLKTNQITMLHFDIKNQFTNLDKNRVINSVSFLLYYLKKIRKNKTFNFCFEKTISTKRE